MNELSMRSLLQSDTIDALSTLGSIQDRGVSLWVQDGQLRFRSPKGVLGPDDLQNLRRLKEEIVALLLGDTVDSDALLTRRSAKEAIPLTPLQYLIWNDAGKYGTWARSHAVVTRIRGDLHVDVLAKALYRATMRHEILRTTLSVVDGIPVRSIDECRSKRLQVVDLAQHDIGAEPAVLEFIDSPIEIGGPLFDSRLFRLGDDDYVLAVSLDQMITDCRSDNLLSRQIWDDYIQGMQGVAADVDRDQLQFADYAFWLGDLFPRWRSLHADYWRAKFSDGGPSWMSQSPRTFSHPARRWKSDDICLEPHAASQLVAFARHYDLYPAIIMLTAYIVAIFNCWRRGDISIAVVDSGRCRPELQSMLGPLVNHLYLRFDVCAELTFAELLRRVTAELHEAYKHRDFNWLPSLVPGIKTELYFNWVTDSGFDSLPPEAQTARAGISLQPYPLRRSGLPPASVGVSLRHAAQISGQLTCEAGLLPAGGGSEVIRLLHAAWLNGIRRPELSIGRLSAGVQ
jgi:hypothetical protein